MRSVRQLVCFIVMVVYNVQTQSHHSSSLLSDINVCEEECVRNLRNTNVKTS